MSNLHQITETLFAVEVPNDAKNFKKEPIRLETSKITYWLSYNYDITNISKKYTKKHIGLFDFKILGTVTTDSIDFDCKIYVELDDIIGYKDYNKDMYACAFKEDSFRSLLKSKGIEPTNETKILIIEKI